MATGRRAATTPATGVGVCQLDDAIARWAVRLCARVMPAREMSVAPRPAVADALERHYGNSLV
ncbi:MAG TPA: hypothetical protein VG916_10440, partial [Gemmatimonadaceae bacterium]|nr:hypothetical protein [Gemmatimonadaceae bacterium]